MAKGIAARAAALDPSARAALAGILRSPKFELVPLKHALQHAAFLPPGATVSVTASPAKGIEATIELSERLHGQGFRVIPHLSARMIRDRAHLRELLSRLDAAGIDRAFVVGGDGEEAGAFPDGLALLRAMADLGPRFTEVGIPCYPQGHPSIPTDRLLAALVDKQPYAQYMTTQMCFDPAAIRSFIEARRAEGITLPVHLGLPGVAELHKLALISARIGVTDSKRFLQKNVRLVGQLVRRGGYRPDGLLESLAPLFADPLADIRDLHLYTFNQVETTEEWRARYLATLEAASAA